MPVLVLPARSTSPRASRRVALHIAPLTEAERRDLFEVPRSRSERTSTLIASQLPPTAWHAAIGEPCVADASCDRLIHHARRLTLKGPTMRDPGTRRPTNVKDERAVERGEAGSTGCAIVALVHGVVLGPDAAIHRKRVVNATLAATRTAALLALLLLASNESAGAQSLTSLGRTGRGGRH